MAAGMSPSPKALRSLVSHTAPAQLTAAVPRETVAMANIICLVKWISPCPVSPLCAIGAYPRVSNGRATTREARNVQILHEALLQRDVLMVLALLQIETTASN